MPEKETVLVTGANGFSGSALVRHLTALGYRVIPVCHHAVGLPGEIVADFDAADFPARVATLPAADAIVHLGTRVGWDASPLAWLYAPNVLATGLFADWAVRHKAYLVFASAAIVCGVDTPRITAASPVQPDTGYGASKHLAEELIRAAGDRHAILRISGIFGKEGPPHLAINRAIAGAAALGTRPVQSGDGAIKRNYLWVGDLCRAIAFALAQRIEGTHLLAGRHVDSMAGMLQAICDVFLPGQTPDVQPGPPGHDQIVEPAPLFPQTLPFIDALRRIKAEWAA